MALTIKMRIDEQPEHSYVFSTGDGGQIELLPLSVVQNGTYRPSEENQAFNLVTVNVPQPIVEQLNITANGTYEQAGVVYDVVTVNVQPLLEAVTRSFTENGTYTIEPTEGYDGISDVTVVVDVPEYIPVLENIQDTITQNGQYTYVPSEYYDGISQIDIEVDVPTGGGTSNVVEGVFTPTDGANQTITTGHTGVVRALYFWVIDKTSLDNLSVQNLTRAYSAVNIGTGNTSYFWKLETHRTGTSGNTLASNGCYQVMSASAQGTAPSNLVGISSDGGTIYYRGKASTGTTAYGFSPQVQYGYLVVYDS